MIPPSPHARGRRPYVFEGAWYGDPIPGTVRRGDRMLAALDAAWLMGDLALVKGEAWAPFSYDSLPPSGMGALYPFQAAGIQWLYQRDYAILADEMGLGKTVQALRAAEARLIYRTSSHQGACVLVLCPAIAKRHWQREIEQWTGHGAVILGGLRAGPIPPARYLIANYDILLGQRRRDAVGKLESKKGLEGWAQALQANLPPIVILDEAHMLRGEKSRRTKAVRALCERATVVWALTGTPMPNHVRDIWALGDIVTGGLLGPYWPFVKAYCGAYKSQYGWVADGGSRLDELGKRLSFWVLGRSKATVGLQLPEKRREIVVVDVDSRAVQQAVNDDRTSFGLASKTNTVAAALRASARAKRSVVTEMAQEALAAGQKVVIGVYLREQAEAVAHELSSQKNLLVGLATGAMSAEARDELARAFRETSDPCAFVCTIDSVTTSISLVGADLVIVGDLTWDPTKLLQFEGRHHRIGSGRSVLIRYLIGAGTIDEAVQETVIDKLSVIEEAIGNTADGKELTAQLGRDTSTTEQIIDRLFAKLTGG